MKTTGLNVKMIMLFTTLLVLSGVIVSGLISSDSINNKDEKKASDDSPSGLNAQVPESVKKTAAEDQDAVEDETGSNKTVKVQEISVLSTRVKTFVPEFDDDWCKARYPDFEGKKISLSSDDLFIIDKKGSRITDYNELILKLSPVSSNGESALEQDYHFDDAYIDVKGVGPMKIKGIKFSFEPAPVGAISGN